jgi:hypothetical protein
LLIAFRSKTAAASAATLSREIFVLKKQLNAVILAHNYQVPEIWTSPILWVILWAGAASGENQCGRELFAGVHHGRDGQNLEPGKS